MRECEKIEELFNQLVNSESIPFTNKGERVQVSKKHGVYFINYDNKVLHVGNTVSGKGGLDQRLNDHRSGTSSFRNNYLKPNNFKLDSSFYFKFIEVENSRERMLLQALTIGKLCPAYIGTGVKKSID
tara:strand:- start:14975 stop:15358 length:384 start_codon:yes stop_codon:yes gene_type:complete